MGTLQFSTYTYTMSQKIITWQEFEKHIHFYDCWVLIQEHVYNVSDFLVQHPGGDSILLKHSGRDGTAGFNGLPHSEYAISLRNSKLVGKIETPSPPEGYLQRIEKAKKESMKKQKKVLVVRQQKISKEQVALHKSQQNCWIILEGKVYDCTDYLEQHPGGIGKIMEWAGKDATKAFREANHSMSAMKTRDLYYIGELQSSKILLYVIILLTILGIGAFVLLN